MNPVHVKLRFVIFLAALLCFLFAAFRDGIGRTKTNFVALGLALWMFVATWDTAAEAW